jgi:predicted transcriptional regulator
LTQRELARLAGVPQSTVGRIEGGIIDPRTTTLDQLLRATGGTLAAEPTLGIGVDRSQIRELLALSPAQRARLAVDDARNLESALSRRRKR